MSANRKGEYGTDFICVNPILSFFPFFHLPVEFVFAVVTCN